MPLFQASVLNSHLRLQDRQQLEEAYLNYTAYFHNPVIQENIRNSKEEQFQATFLNELFVKVLGYTLNPNPDYNLTTEFRNETNNRKADGAILFNGTALGVIELKGTNTKDLESIRRQAFDYKANQKGCVYVVTSNFEKLRFYVNDATEYEEFNLFELGKEDFALLLLCLQKGNIQQNLPLKIKGASLVVEEEITRKFYSDYSIFKRELYQDLVKRNLAKLKLLQPAGIEMEASEASEEPNADEDPLEREKGLKLLLFKKSQKLIDRFLFVFFAEDRNLLPPNSTMQILDKWKADMDFGDERPIYDLFKQYFGFLDTGRQGTASRAEIYAYNGGLFKPDEILDRVEIDSEMLHKHTRKLASYDFESQVDVNILGHIFENSLNEIEGMTSEIEGTDFEKQKSKRKKDGVFYTPKYITKYIVENTVGKLCAEKKQELGFREEEYYEGRSRKHKKTIAALVKVLDDYREWLLQLSICDPACGSGAFLNQALDFLIKEHTYIDELKTKLLGGSLVLSDIETTILENNIYGVDINEESVEIAKLSLWLRTAQPRRKLNDLSSNIKCGNSLIDDPAVAGEKAFKWEEEFPEIFARGGFDVVIGNPPYVRLESIRETSVALENLRYVTFDKRGDIYCVFVEKGYNILKADGLLSYIMPNKWLQAGYGGKLREFLLSTNILKFIDFGDNQIFKGATTYPCIFITQKSKSRDYFDSSILDSVDSVDFETNVAYSSQKINISQLSGETWILSAEKETKILNRIKSHTVPLSKFVDSANYGIKTGLTEAFIISEDVKNQLVESNQKALEVIQPLLLGRDVKPYSVPYKSSYLILFEKGYTKSKIGDCDEEEAWGWLIKEFPSISGWLKPFEDRAKKRTDLGDYWWELRACDYYDQFQKPKIMYQKFQVRPCFIYDEEITYCNDSMWIIPTTDKVLLGILNSQLGWWLIKKYCTQIQNGCQLIWKYFRQIPIPETNGSALIISVDEMLKLTSSQETIVKKFQNFMMLHFSMMTLPKKLLSWHQLSYKEFISELNKAIRLEKGVLTKKEEFEWMDLFEENKKKAQELQQQIAQTDREIDKMVYELYGLTEEEIAVVEGA